MILIQGKGVSSGVVKGKLYFYERPDTTVVKTTVDDLEAEKARLAEAQAKSIAQLEALAEKCREEAGDESAILFETHAMFVEDDDYVECIMETLDDEQCNAEYAVEVAGEQFAQMFAAMDDAYMQARAADIKDVTRRILNNLMGIPRAALTLMNRSFWLPTTWPPLRPSRWTRARFLALPLRAAPATATLLFWPEPWVSPLFAVWARP